MLLKAQGLATPIYVIGILCLWTSPTLADYTCLCNYNVEEPVHQKATPSSGILGYMYEFDCKPLVGTQDTAGWHMLAFNHQLGYVSTDDQIETQTCAGDPPAQDRLPVTTTASTTKVITTTGLSSTLSTASKTTTTSRPSSQPTTPVPTSSSTRLSTSRSTTSSTQSSTSASTAPSTSKWSTSKTQTTTTLISTSTSTPTPISSSTSTKPTTPTPTSSTTPLTSRVTLTTTPSSAHINITTPTESTSHKPLVTGNTNLCPAILHQYAREDGAALTQYGDYCYELVPIRGIWERAERDCIAKGGYLIHISDQALQDFIYGWIRSYKFDHAVWIGLHDLWAEEHFEWISGDHVVYTNWYPDRKGNLASHHNEDCVLLVPYAPYFGKWDDVICGQATLLGYVGQQNPFICEYSIHPHHSVIVG